MKNIPEPSAANASMNTCYMCEATNLSDLNACVFDVVENVEHFAYSKGIRVFRYSAQQEPLGRLDKKQVISYLAPLLAKQFSTFKSFSADVYSVLDNVEKQECIVLSINGRLKNSQKISTSESVRSTQNTCNALMDCIEFAQLSNYIAENSGSCALEIMADGRLKLDLTLQDTYKSDLSIPV